MKNLAVVVAILLSTSAWATPQRIIGEPAGETTYAYGRLALLLRDGAIAEVDPQPGMNAVRVRSVAGVSARIAVSARYFVLVESLHGTTRILLPSRLIITVPPGKAEIVGRALRDDPGMIVIQIEAEALVTVLDDPPQAAIRPFPEKIEAPISPSTLRRHRP
jgi:hypothetical protein